MLTRKRVLVASVAAVMIAVGWLIFADRGPPYGVTRPAYRAIQFGMSMEEVECLIGQSALPHGLVLSSDGSVRGMLSVVTEEESDERFGPEAGEAGWFAEDAVLEVYLNQDRLVCKKRF